jgi:hypothetical protein
MERKLAFDPTPEHFVFSLRKRYKGMWKRIRDRRFAPSTAAFLCDICGSDRGKREWLDAHEVYSFPRPGVVKLDKIVFVCKHCHEAIHLERTRRTAGPKWRAEVEAHYCKVNDIAPAALEQDFHDMMMRSKELRLLYGREAPVMDYGEFQRQADLCESRNRPGTDALNSEDDDDDFEQYPDHECPDDTGHAD